MIKRWRYPLFAKLLALNLGLSALAVAVAGVLTYELARAALRREMVAAGKTLVESFARTNALEWLDESKGSLNLRIRLAGLIDTDREHVLAAYALDRDRRVLAAVESKAGAPVLGSTELLAAPSGQEPLVLARSGTLTIVSPVVYDGITLGYTAFLFNDDLLADAGTKMLSSSAAIILVLVVLEAAALALVLRALLRPIVELGHAAREFGRGNYRYRLQAKLADDEIGAAGRSFNTMCDALELHIRFSNAALVERIRAGAAVDDVQEPDLSVVFGDARSYTRWSQRQRAHEIFGALNRHFTCFGRVTVARFNGIIDKFMGDGVMAYFGLPQARELGSREHVRDALRATVYAQMVLRVLGYVMRLERQEPLDYRFGIASGRCLVGAIGAKDVLLDYSLIGHVVNLAARLEGKAPPGGVAIDRFTLTDAGEGFVDAVNVGEQRIKGLDAPVEVFVVRGLADEVELERLRAFLLDELLDDPVLRPTLVGDEPTPERLAEIRRFIAREASQRPSLPI